MGAAPTESHHVRVETWHSLVTKTLPKHLVNRHLTSLASGDIIDDTGRRRKGSRSGEAVCLETVTKYNNCADGQGAVPCPDRRGEL